MKIAVIGAGFAGLGVCAHLAKFPENFSITLFDESGPGSKTSGIAAGLCHPFPAKLTRLSFKGYEGLHETLLLLQKAQKKSQEPLADFSGIIKLALDTASKKELSKLSFQHPRLSWLSDAVITKIAPSVKEHYGLLIENGITVYTKAYLEALFMHLLEKNVIFKQKKILDLDELSDFDQIILCTGASIKHFYPKEKNLSYTKGQVLLCRADRLLTRKSLSLDGYIAVTKDEKLYYMGSTYEHEFTDELPDRSFAKEKIFKGFSSYNIDLGKIEVLEAFSGVRVFNKKSFLPVIKKFSNKVFGITALGSRGLLYHALLGKELTTALLKNDTSLISREFFQIEN